MNDKEVEEFLVKSMDERLIDVYEWMQKLQSCEHKSNQKDDIQAIASCVQELSWILREVNRR